MVKINSFEGENSIKDNPIKYYLLGVLGGVILYLFITLLIRGGAWLLNFIIKNWVWLLLGTILLFLLKRLLFGRRK